MEEDVPESDIQPAVTTPPPQVLDKLKNEHEFVAERRRLFRDRTMTTDARFIVTQPGYEPHLFIRLAKLWDDVYDLITLSNIYAGDDAPFDTSDAYWRLWYVCKANLYALAALSDKPEYSRDAIAATLWAIRRRPFDDHIPMMLHEIDRLINLVDLGPKKKPATTMFDLDVDAIMQGHWRRIAETPIPVQFDARARIRVQP